MNNPIYVWVDGAKGERDASLANICLDLLMQESKLNIVKIQKNTSNFGNAKSIPSAIDWVFQFVDQVVIIEDDVILSKNFFLFAESTLEFHKHNPKIVGVSALNTVPQKFISNPSLPFRYSTYASVWGWALTKNSWLELRELLLIRVPIIHVFPISSKNFAAKRRWRSHLLGIEQNFPVSWDYRLQLAVFSLEKYFVVPNVNYSLNIGFGEGATNTTSRPDWVPSNYGIFTPLNDALVINTNQDLKADNWVATYMHHTKNIYWLKTLFKKFGNLCSISK